MLTHISSCTLKCDALCCWTPLVEKKKNKQRRFATPIPNQFKWWWQIHMNHIERKSLSDLSTQAWTMWSAGHALDPSSGRSSVRGSRGWDNVAVQDTTQRLVEFESLCQVSLFLKEQLNLLLQQTVLLLQALVSLGRQTFIHVHPTHWTRKDILQTRL